jgi:hypothetical protein
MVAPMGVLALQGSAKFQHLEARSLGALQKQEVPKDAQEPQDLARCPEVDHLGLWGEQDSPDPARLLAEVRPERLGELAAPQKRGV